MPAMLIVLALLMLSGGEQARAATPVSIRSGAITLCGFLTAPDRPAMAGVVIIHGSGPDGGGDYEAEARRFADIGIAALTYDKRGWGCSGGDWRNRRVDLLAQDATAAAQKLRELIRQPVGYWGISQGGWVLAKVGATDPAAAFLIGVAASGVSPVQQERWHKRQMMKAADYPPWAEALADRYWTAALDLMIWLDRVPGFVPFLLEGERAGSSFGLNYDPAPDWGRSRAPLLLMYGSSDQLQPWFDSGPRIAWARPRSSVTRVVQFDGASHAITTRTTGLAFDWGTDLADGYGPTIQRFLSDPSAGPEPPVDPVPAWPAASPWSAPWALASLVGLPILMLVSALRDRQRPVLIMSGLGLGGWVMLIALLTLAVHPQGSFFDPAARFPAWGWLLPAFAMAAIIPSAMVLSGRGGAHPPRLMSRIAAAGLVLFHLTWFKII